MVSTLALTAQTTTWKWLKALVNGHIMVMENTSLAPQIAQFWQVAALVEQIQTARVSTLQPSAALNPLMS